MSEFPWSEFKTGTPSPKGSIDCADLDTVTHISHVESALSIARSHMIRPQLVYDESNLNTSRILVTWVSPNHWHDGSRYGNVQFAFDWRSIFKGKRCYWVESIKKYSPPACRFLLSENDHSKNSLLTPYDPRTSGGPWLYVAATDKHYWNGNFTLEFMIEKELTISDWTEISFVKHHAKYCCLRGVDCFEYASSDWQGGARFVSGLITLGIPAHRLKLVKLDGELRKPSDDLIQAIFPIQHKLNGINRKEGFTGTFVSSSPEARAIMKAMFAAHYRDEDHEFTALASLFSNAGEAGNALETVLKETFQTESFFP